MPSPTDRPSPKEMQDLGLPTMEAANAASSQTRRLIGMLDDLSAALRVRKVSYAKLDHAAEVVRNAVTMIEAACDDIRETILKPEPTYPKLELVGTFPLKAEPAEGGAN